MMPDVLMANTINQYSLHFCAFYFNLRKKQVHRPIKETLADIKPPTKKFTAKRLCAVEDRCVHYLLNIHLIK